MVELHVALTAQEKDFLINLLQSALGDTRVEAHRTHTPGYREQVLGREDLIRELLAKLRALA